MAFCNKYGLVVAGTLLLAGCGGGGGSASTTTPSNPGTGTTPSTPTAPTWTAGVFSGESNYKDFCAAPRSGLDPYSGKAYPDKAGTAMHEKMWLRSWSNRMYLWYRELPDNDPQNFDTKAFFAQLKTTALIDSGAPKDRFHWSSDTAEYLKETQGGVSSGYGFEWQVGQLKPPRKLTIRFNQPQSPAAQAGVSRGDQLIQIDGVDFVNDDTQSGVDKLNAGLFPSKTGESHQFVFLTATGTQRTVTLSSADVAIVPVQNAKVIAQNGKKIGYLQFDTHIAAAQPQLIAAVKQFRDAAVSELVVDLRYNGGGLLALASQFAYMVTGPSITQSQTFEQLRFNDKYPNTDPENGRALQPTPFYGNVIDYTAGYLTNETLPSLNLTRIVVLSSDNTCSASEAFINSLRGINVDVVLVGGKTCGKPYGFYPKDNCGTTYFSIQFTGVNAKGFGDYADGFNPALTPKFNADIQGCPANDDFSKALGDPAELMLKTGLYYLENKRCPTNSFPAGVSALSQTTASPALSGGLSIKEPKQHWQDSIRTPIQ